MATEQERIAFCKVAAELGYTPSELVEAYRSKEAAGWISDLLGSVVKAAPAALDQLLTTPIQLLGLAATVGAAGGAGIASIKGLARNEYPHLFTGEGSPASSELKEERLRQLIARYQNASTKIKEMEIYNKDVQNPDKSPMMRYEFGGFGE